VKHSATWRRHCNARCTYFLKGLDVQQRRKENYNLKFNSAANYLSWLCDSLQQSTVSALALVSLAGDHSLTLALASLAASASAAMALCSWTGSLTSFLLSKTQLIRIPNVYVYLFFIIISEPEIYTFSLQKIFVHFDPLDLDPPGVGGFVQGGLHTQPGVGTCSHYCHKKIPLKRRHLMSVSSISDSWNVLFHIFPSLHHLGNGVPFWKNLGQIFCSCIWSLPSTMTLNPSYLTVSL
jgi:hypothetical protein